MEGVQKNKAIIFISLLSVLTGTLVITGYIFHINFLESVVPGFIRMKINPAVCFLALGIALLLTQLAPFKYSVAIFYIFTLLVTAIGLITMLEYLFQFRPGIDQLLVTDKEDIWQHYPYPGRMALITSVCLFLLGFALSGLNSAKSTLYKASQYLLHLVTVISSIAIIGYLYGVSLLYSLLTVSHMALHTAINLFLLSVGASLLRPGLGATGLFTGKRIGNLMAKRLFVVIAVMVIAFGMLSPQTANIHLFSKEIGASWLIILFLISCLFIIWATAKWLNRIDEQRSIAEEEVKKMNALLEKRVEERSAELIQSLDKLQKSEEKYRSLIEQASDAIFMLDPEFNFIEVNNSMCAMVGYHREELLSMHFSDLIDPEQLKIDPLDYKRLAPDSSKMRERKFLTKAGVLVEVEMNIKKMVDSRPMVIARDITKRKVLETELKHAELKFRTLADKSIVGIYIVKKGRFSYVNPRFAEIFGYEPQELIWTEPVDTIIDQDHKAMVNEHVRARIAGEIDSVHYEAKGKKKDGTSNWVEFYGSSVMFENELTIIGSMLDITERKLAEDLILKEKALSDTTINSLPGILYLKNKSGDFLLWNRNLEILTGSTYNEIKNLAHLQFIAEEDRETVVTAIDKALSDGNASAEAKIMTLEGKKVPHLITYSRINYQNQQCYLAIGINIAERVKATEELRLSEQKYKLLFEDNPMPMWMVVKNDLSIIAANTAAARLYGYTKDELLKLNIKDLRLAEDMKQVEQNYLIKLHGSKDMGVTKHIKKDGSLIDVQIIAHDIIFEGKEVRLAHTNDVTEKLKIEQAHQKSEANLQTILNNTDTSYLLLDNELRILEYNNKAAQFSTNEFDLILERGKQIPAYQKLSRFKHSAMQVLKGDTISYEASYPQTDGTSLWYYIRMFPVSNKENNILGLMMAATDITESKNNEQSLREAYEHIQTHINSIREITWKQSHLIRSPLANLKGLMPLMESEPDNKEVLGYIFAELDRMDSVIIEMAKGSD